LKKRYDEQVGEAGVLLSVGQKQLISFARAVLADPKIFVMDEATSYADLILPDHTFLERWQDDEIDPSVGFPLFGIRQPVVEPLYNTMNSADVMIQIAKAIGGSVANAFPWEDYQEMIKQRVRGIFDAQNGSIVAQDFEDFWDKLLESGGWWNRPYEYGRWAEVFTTPSKRFEFYSQIMKQRLDEFAAKQAKEAGTDAAQEFEEILKGFRGKAFHKRKINLEVAEGKKRSARSDSGRYKKRDSFKRKSVGRKAERKRKKRI